MSEEKEVKISNRTIIIKGYDDHIEVHTEGYQHYLMIIFELQTAIGLITKEAQQKSNIIIPNIAGTRRTQ